MVPVNYFAVLAAAILNMVIGGLWYGPMFQKMWLVLSGLTDQQLEAAKAKGMGKIYAMAFLSSLLMSYVLAHALIFASAYLNASGISAGLTAGFWNWVGFVVPVTLGIVLWEGKPWKLWFLNSGYYLVSLLCMGVLLALWK